MIFSNTILTNRIFDQLNKRHDRQDFILKSFQAEHGDVIFINCTALYRKEMGVS